MEIILNLSTGQDLTIALCSFLVTARSYMGLANGSYSIGIKTNCFPVLMEHNEKLYHKSNHESKISHLMLYGNLF